MRTFAGGWVMQGVLPASDVSPRILLIDDERRILDFVARGLRGQGYRADAGSGWVSLAQREFLLLQELMRSAGQTVSKERLLSSVWGYYFDSGSNVVDVYVARLRRKLGADTIETVRGEGYRLDAS